ncbi:chaperonin 10-like protein [Hypoxylon sp. FL0543]|nr:chaperonin 10-like protein [Hypoxylon sp. FL0543]
MATHLAAVATGRAQPLEVQERQTLKPGPDEVLVGVKSIAPNPIDWKMHDGGVGLEAGSKAPDTFIPGARITAFAPAFFTQGVPNHGAFQERAIVPAPNISLVPDSVTFNEAAIFRLAVATI